MTTYEIPEPPEDLDEVWGPSADGEGWCHYKRAKQTGRRYWHRWENGQPPAGPYSWVDLLQMGPLVDEDPDPSLEVLAERVLMAAQTWNTETWHDSDYSIAARDGLKAAVRNYNKKKGNG